MAEGKWIEGLDPNTPLAAAARHVLRVRLEVVRDALSPAARESDQDPEHVHRLRVATRRADAALRIFRPCMAEKTFKSARRRLKRIRRAAGQARDWDVFLLDLVDRRVERPAVEHPGFDFLAGYASGQRAVAAPELEEAWRNNEGDFDAFIDETLALVNATQGASLLQLARPLLANLSHRLEEAAGGNLKDYAHLHQVRIAGKRLRYAMEVFGDCFPAAFRESVYPQVEEMQEVLGRANDSHVASGRLGDLRGRLRKAMPEEWRRVRGGVEAVLRFHNSRLPRERRRFVEWWRRWSAGAGTELAAMLHASAPPAAVTG